MIDSMNLEDSQRNRTIADDADRTDQATGWRRWAGALLHRWPTALGIAVAAGSALDLETGLEFAALTVLMAVIYLGAAAFDRPWTAWVVLFAGLPLAFALPTTSWTDRSMILIVVGAVLAIVGVTRGLLVKPGGLPLQTFGMLAFGSAILVALYVDPGLGGKLVGITILGHGAWDAYHYLRNTVVQRSYAEFCAVVDLLLGAAILVMT
jgi:ABC-type multidrug transport system permease subunit